MLIWRRADNTEQRLRLLGDCSKLKRSIKSGDSGWITRRKVSATCASCAHRLKASCTGGEALLRVASGTDERVRAFDIGDTDILTYIAAARSLLYHHEPHVGQTIDSFEHNRKTSLDRYLRFAIGPVIPFMKECDKAAYSHYKTWLNQAIINKREEVHRKRYQAFNMSKTMFDHAHELVCERMTVHSVCAYQFVGMTTTQNKQVGRIYFGNYRGDLQHIDLKYEVISNIVRESYFKVRTPETSKRFKVVFRQGYAGNRTYIKRKYAGHRAEMLDEAKKGKLKVLVDNPKKAAL